jgi:hypothetical protein
MIGAEIFVLRGSRGEVGVNGPAEMDGDVVESRESSSATTTFAGMPRRMTGIGQDRPPPWSRK